MQYTTFLVIGPEFLKNDIRIKLDLDALGALGDTGWYCTRGILWANEYELPKTVTALPEPEYNEACVILSCGASPEKKWPTISRKTQLVIDGVMASIEKGFAPVEVVP
ncbi:unnamed protein product [Ilex paraguariensis]|uniref:Uncharacterized protein n=1 Tax=Ilex paraguariensis TaxID=185542 RepID=A0ABC8RKF6_9AQUA